MINYMKHSAAKLPKSLQQELKRLHYWRQIASNKFISKEPEWEILDKFISNGDFAIDIGANVGHYTARLSEIVGPDGRVIAIEPIPQTFYLLSSNVGHFNYKNVSLFSIAISNYNSCVRFDVPQFNTGLENYYQAHISERNSSKLTILCISIDSLHLPFTVSLLKIDTEGHDFQAIIGAKNLISKSKPIIIVEGHNPQILELLREMGYNSKTLSGSPNTIYKI